MSSLQVIVTLIFFILASVFSLVLAITGKSRSKTSAYYVVAIHFSMLLMFLMILFGVRSGEIESVYGGYLFLLFVCSGLIAFGWILRIPVPLALKVYFGIFTLSIAGFIIRPSMIIYILGTGKFQMPPQQEFLVENNLFVQEQQSMIKSDRKYPRYKLVRKSGSFTKSLSRDLDFKGALDSIRVLNYDEELGEVAILGYITRITPLETYTDSTRCDIVMGFEADEITIERNN